MCVQPKLSVSLLRVEPDSVAALMRRINAAQNALHTFEGDSYYVVIAAVQATSAAHRTPVRDVDRWFWELDWIVDGIRE